MIFVALILAGALAPGVFLLHFFYVRDIYQREPLRRLIRVYLVSCLTVIPAILLELPLSLVSIRPFDAMFVGLIEEGVKFLFFWWLVSKALDFDEPYDGILYAVAVSLGFATVENVLYSLGSLSVVLVIARAILSVPGHCLWGVIMGWFLGRWRFETDPKIRRGLLWQALLIPAFLHGLFDLLLFAAEDTGGFSALGSLVLIAVQWYFGMKLVHRAQAASPFKRPSIMDSPIAALDMRYKYCQHCGAKSLRDDAFCAKCGTAFPARTNPSEPKPAKVTPTSGTCPNCSATVQEKDRFCPKCGQALPAPTTA